MTRRRAALLVVLSVMATAACSSQVRLENAVKRIARAADATALRTGRLTISSTAPDVGLPQPKGLPVAPRGSVSMDVVLDPEHDRAALLAPATLAARIGPTPSGGRPAVALFAGDDRFVRSADIGAIGARPWFRLEGDDLDALSKPKTKDLQKPPTVGALALLSPLTIVEACHGVLTGSVEISDAGAGTRYDGKTSLDKVARSLDRDPTSIRPLQDALRFYAAGDDINAIKVWLAPNGDLARVVLTYTQRPEKGAKATVTYDLTLDPMTAQPDRAVLARPTEDDVVDAASFGDLRASLEQLAKLTTEVQP